MWVLNEDNEGDRGPSTESGIEAARIQQSPVLGPKCGVGKTLERQ